ncbi:MAG: TraR/DksA C4-type zinc finger protein [Planctomycetaceae bacterium]
MKSEDLKEFRKMLRLMQARLQGDVEQIEEEAFSAAANGSHGSSNHMAEMGTDAWDLDFSLRIVENDQEVLSEIAAALKKIDQGTFGLCEMCLEKGAVESKAGIPKARLRAIPYARNCVNCERKREEEH